MNTLVSYDGSPAYLYNVTSSGNMIDQTLYTNASKIFANSNCNHMFYTIYNNTSFINYSTLEKFNFSRATYAHNMFRRVDFKGTPSSLILDFSNLENATNLFSETNFNANVIFSNALKYASGAFIRCNSLNKNIYLPNSIIEANDMFNGTSAYNQNIRFPSNLVNAANMFAYSGICKAEGNADSLKNGFSLFMYSNLKEINATFNSINNCYLMFADCNNLTQVNVMFGENADNVSNAFLRSKDIGGNFYFDAWSINAQNMFRNVGSGKRKNIYTHVPYYFTGNVAANSIMGKAITWSENSQNDCTYNTTYNIFVYYRSSFT